jgi:high-affinity iron transporter
MLAIWILVFREVLEAAMIVSVVAAATRGVEGRWRWIGSSSRCSQGAWPMQ